MATVYTDVYDLFLQQIKDYNLTELYKRSETDFNTYLQGFLVLAISEFLNCSQDLTDRNDTTGTFNIDLSEANKFILSKLMTKYWLKKEVQDIMQMNLHLTDKDFKHYSEAQNLKSKSNHYHTLSEEIAQDLVNYGFEQVDWDAWGNGEF